MSTPEERLCSRSWRLRNSLWLLPAILLLGLATWASFLYVGLKTKSRIWLVSAGLYGVAAVVASVVLGVYGDEAKATSTAGESIGASVAIVAWIVGMVHGYFANRQWLLWKSRADDIGPWYAREGGPVGQDGYGTAPAPTPDDILRGAAHPLDRSTSPGTPAPPPPPPPPPPSPRVTGPIDINAASAAELTSGLGLSEELASTVIAERDRLGRFTTPDQLMTAGGVPPHVYASIRDRLVVRDSGPTGGLPPTRGRRLEL